MRDGDESSGIVRKKTTSKRQVGDDDGKGKINKAILLMMSKKLGNSINDESDMTSCCRNATHKFITHYNLLS